MAGFLRIFHDERLEFLRIRRVALLAVAKLFGQPLGQNAEQGIGKIERVHANVEQASDGLGR